MLAAAPLRHHPFKPAPSRFYLAGAEPTTVDDTAPLAEVSNRVHGGLMPDCPATAKGGASRYALGVEERYPSKTGKSPVWTCAPVGRRTYACPRALKSTRFGYYETFVVNMPLILRPC